MHDVEIPTAGQAMMTVKRLERTSFVVLVVIAVASLVLAAFSRPQLWISTASVLFGLAGVVQFEISGLFERWMEKYGDEQRYPYGPPSRITREIIDDPDRPLRMWVRNTAFFDRRTGFYLIVAGALIQLFGIWL